jgi:hypothetical protein
MNPESTFQGAYDQKAPKATESYQFVFSIAQKLVVGLAGFEPTTFTRKQRLSVPTGFSKTAPEFRHSSGRGQQTRCLLSGARRHTCLDYSPTLDLRH